MNDEKKYNEALERARKLYEQGTITESLCYVFPELKESEDERVRKAIKYGIDHVFTNNTTVFEVTKEQCLAWLEKQGKQKPIVEMKSAEESLGIDSDTYNKIVDECIYGEQKSTWSDGDEAHLHSLITHLEQWIESNPGTTGADIQGENVAWLKSLRPQNRWKPSDAQMASITCAVRKMKESACYDSELVSLYNDLKKLREE